MITSNQIPPMAFKKLAETQIRPARRWALVGFPGDGKSSFAAQMQTPILPIDVDGRFREVEHLANGTVFALSEKREENNDVQAIDRLLDKHMSDSGVRTIVVDSVTPIFQRITRRHQVEEHEGETKGNKSAVHREKADVMALLGAAVTGYGTDTLWIWHLNTSSFNGKHTQSQSVSETERDRLRKFLNAELHVVVDKNGRRGIVVAWSRSGHGIGQTIYDTQENFDTGFFWKGMPERIEALIYPAVVARGPGASAAPTADGARSFANAEDAINWGLSQINAPAEEVSALYAEVKAAAQPKSSREMWAAWVAEIAKRQATLTAAVSTGF
jgi:hypothetical protein